MPTPEEIEALHRKYAKSQEAFELVYTHSQIVGEIALQLVKASGVDVDIELVRAGSLLHDIGAYRLFDDGGRRIVSETYITHGIEGEAMLREEGLPAKLARIASHHTGAGISKEQIIDRHLPLPAQDFFAESLEEKLVMYADKFHSKSTPPTFLTYDYYHQYAARFGEEVVRSFELLKETFGVPELAELSGRYGYKIKDKA